MKRSLFLSLFMLLAIANQAAVIESVANGNWNTGSTWNTGTVPQPGDDVHIHHAVVLNTSITFFGSMVIDHGASLMPSGNSQDITVNAGGAIQNHGKVGCRNFNLYGSLDNYNDGLAADSFFVNNNANIFAGGTINNWGRFYVSTITISAGGTIYNNVPIGTFFISNKLDNSGTVDNDWIISVSGNLINNTGTLTGNGGTYYCNPTFTNNSTALVTCNGLPINICRPDGTDPIVNGSGTVNYPCALLCNGPWPQPQPVVIASFEAAVKDGAIALAWVTSSETQLSKFVIEKAVTANEEEACKVGACGTTIEFKPIGTVEAKDKPSNYGFTDVNPVKGMQYYRLKIVNDDNSSEYSKVVNVFYDQQGHSLLTFPNPTNEKLNIRITGTQNVKATVNIYTIDGRLVWESSSQMTDGDEMFSLPVCDFASGAYIVTMVQGDKKLSKKVIFQGK